MAMALLCNLQNRGFITALWTVTLVIGCLANGFDLTLLDLTMMTIKSEPLYLCDKETFDIQVSFPKPPLCFSAESFDTNKVVNISLYLPDLNAQVIKSYECFAKEVSTEVFTTVFWGTRGRMRKSKIKIGHEVCSNMVRTKTTPEGFAMAENKEGLISYESDVITERKWLRTTFNSTIHYYFRETAISVYGLDEPIIAHTQVSQRCLFDRGYCETEAGLIIWDVKDVKQCKLLEIASTECIFSANNSTGMISCPKLELTFTGLHEAQMCGLNFMRTDQGYFILQCSLGELNDRISLRTEADTIISRKRVRREGEQTNPYDSVLNSKLTHAYESLRQSVEDAFKIIHYEICSQSTAVWRVLLALVELGHPTPIIQHVYNDKSLRARMTGDILILQKCVQVSRYQFLSPHPSNCYQEYPVKYQVDQKIHEGFLRGNSHEIVSKPTLIQHTNIGEQCPDFYFRYQETIIKLGTSGPEISHIPSFPLPSRGILEVNLPRIGFKSSSFLPSPYKTNKQTRIIGQDQGISNIMLKRFKNDGSRYYVQASDSAESSWLNQVSDGVGTVISSASSFLAYLLSLDILTLVIVILFLIFLPSLLHAVLRMVKCCYKTLITPIFCKERAGSDE